MQRMNRMIVGLCAVSLGILAFGAAVSAAPVIDGRYDAAEGYTTLTHMLLMVEGGPTSAPDPATMWTCQDPCTGDVSVVFIQPLTLVDNTYADGADDDAGQGYVAGDWGGTAHKFDKLERSDKAEFELWDGNGNMVLNFEMDYLKADHGVYTTPLKDDHGKITKHSSSLLYNLSTDLTAVGGEGTGLGYSSRTDYSPEIVDGYVAGTTPVDYTLRNADLGDPGSDPGTDFPGWEFAVIYEYKVDGDLFAANGFGGVTVPVVHDSPNKVDRNKVWPDPTGLRLLKFDDESEDGIYDGDEVLLEGWEFLLEGPNCFSMLLTTGPDGTVSVTGLEPGTYTITETMIGGWDVTTPNPLQIDVLKDQIVTAEFGNHEDGNGRIPEPAAGSLFLLGLIAARRRRRK